MIPGMVWTLLRCRALEDRKPEIQHTAGERWLPLVMIVAAALGVGLRIRMYLENRSLWLDPAMLALNVIDKNALELMGRLDWNQAAPPAFLLLAKAIGSVFDYHELALSFPSLIFGTGAFLLFIRLATAVLGPARAPFAYIPMATCSTAIFYCSEFRPQSADLFFAVAILLVGRSVVERRWAPSALAGFTALGIISVWFSYAALFVVAGVGGVLVALAVASYRDGAGRRMVLVFTIVMVHFALLYLLHIRPSVGPDLHAANTAAFAPVVNVGHGKWWWWILAARGYFEFPLGFWGLYVIPALGLGIGAVYSLRTRKTAATAAMAGAPIALLLIASSLGKYPITTGIHEVRSRFVLFTIASALLFTAFGISRCCEWTRHRKIVSVPLIALLLIPSLYGGFTGPRFRGQEVRPLITHLRQHLETGDAVYVFHASVPAFRYYTRDEPVAAVLGRPPRPGASDLADDLRRLRENRRLWVIASHTYNGERRVIRRTLREMGRLSETRHAPGAVLFRCALDP
jgi:hypothetical protein